MVHFKIDSILKEIWLSMSTVNLKCLLQSVCNKHRSKEAPKTTESSGLRGNYTARLPHLTATVQTHWLLPGENEASVKSDFYHFPMKIPKF